MANFESDGFASGKKEAWKKKRTEFVRVKVNMARFYVEFESV